MTTIINKNNNDNNNNQQTLWYQKEICGIKTGELHRTSSKHLIDNLTSFGNVLSKRHEKALRSLLRLYNEIIYGGRTGRYAVPLFTGGGKTQSIVALLSAANELGMLSEGDDCMSVAVCASKVEALCDLKRDLINTLAIKHTNYAA